MNLTELKARLSKFKKEDITISYHAIIKAKIRKINLEEVKENIINPKKLVYTEQQIAKHPNEEKYDCYFAISNEFSHRYVLVINGKVIIVTIIKIRREWQKIIEKKLK